jgi:hypothetical protein
MSFPGTPPMMSREFTYYPRQNSYCGSCPDMIFNNHIPAYQLVGIAVRVVLKCPDPAIGANIRIMTNINRVLSAIKQTILVNDNPLTDFYFPEIQDSNMHQNNNGFMDVFIEEP